MLTKPIPHLNGSGIENLRRQYREAYDALHKAIGALIEMSPHSRDYYVSPDPDAYSNARKEHRARIAKLNEVLDEVSELMNALEDNVQQRRNPRNHS